MSGQAQGSVSRRLLPILACVLVVMIGVGITLPVMPFFVERLTLDSGAGSAQVALHVGLLTAAFPLMQLLFAPLWGRLSDRIGRRPLVIIGVSGFAVTQVLFGAASGLSLLYAARILGGALSSALLPAASAYVADATSHAERGRGMAWLNIAVGLGTILGPAFGGILVREDLHVGVEGVHLLVGNFSIPYFAAAGLAVIALVVALITLPSSPATRVTTNTSLEARAEAMVPQPMPLLLAVALAGYFGIAIFETTFAIYAMQRYEYAPGGVAAVFVLCGSVMVVSQLAGAWLATRMGELRHVALGFGLMSVGLAMLAIVEPGPLVFVAVAALGAGMSFFVTSLATMVSQRDSRKVGAALGLQNSAVGAGQAGGPLVGTFLFGWRAEAPYVVAAAAMGVVGLALFLRASRRIERARDRRAPPDHRPEEINAP